MSNNKRVNKILVLGAFDRFNYGDLLFPIMVELSLEGKIKNDPDEAFQLMLLLGQEKGLQAV